MSMATMWSGIFMACVVTLTIEVHDRFYIESELTKIEIEEKKLSVQLLKMQLANSGMKS